MPSEDPDYPTCQQKGCDAPATHRFTWAGGDERMVCLHHAMVAHNIADAMGYPLQILPLTKDTDHADPH